MRQHGRASSRRQWSWDTRASGHGETQKHQEQVRTPSPVSPTRRQRYHLTKNDEDEHGSSSLVVRCGHPLRRLSDVDERHRP
jgi:hypothetical protein